LTHYRNCHLCEAICGIEITGIWIGRAKARFENATVRLNGKLLLIGRRQLRSNNSWMHNSQRLVKGKPRCTMLMHPRDAEHRELTAGQEVRVRSRAGSLDVPLEITEDIMPGVVSIPHGWGHDRDGVQLEVARKHAGASINDVTDSLAIDELCSTAAFNGTWVEVEGGGLNYRLRGLVTRTASHDPESGESPRAC
jgi:anaerobic selenocysteine-containing dehydrogenase